jgi:hypothetical protein
VFVITYFLPFLAYVFEFVHKFSGLFFNPFAQRAILRYKAKVKTQIEGIHIMKKALVLLLMTSLIGPAALAKGKGKRKRDPNAPNLDPLPSQMIGQSAKNDYERSGNSNNRKSAGYSITKSQQNYQESFQFIAEHADRCKFSRGATLAVSIGGSDGMQRMYGTAAAMGGVYKMFHSAFDGNIKYELHGDPAVRDDSVQEDERITCTTNKKLASSSQKAAAEAEKRGEEAKESFLHVDEDVFKWSTGVIFASHRIGQVLDEIGWDKVKVDGIIFKAVNANGSYIEAYNQGCSLRPVKHSPLIGRDSIKYYYEVSVDLGNFRTNLNKDTIRECLTSHPINN